MVARTLLRSRALRVKNPRPYSSSTSSNVRKQTYVASQDDAQTPTPIEKLLSDSINASGPVPVSTFTQFCLSHPTEGYYMKQRQDGADVFGVRGDFITSPEISQIFGEVGIWLLSQWIDASSGRPFTSKIRLVELGPGRGTLMDDIVRTLFTWSHAKAALSSIHLIETSPVLRSRQDQKLATWRDSHRLKLEWHDSIGDIPQASNDEFTMIVAHEFFDALPVNVLQKTPDGFREVLVDLQNSHGDPSTLGISDIAPTSSAPFRFVLSPTPTARSNLLSTMSPRFAALPTGSRIEVSTAGWQIAREIGQIVSHSGDKELDVNPTAKSKVPKGAGLIIDYGDEHVFGTSFRAFRAHRLVEVFDRPGMSDLTTNVDFAFLKEALEGIAVTHGPLKQSTFLQRMGFTERLTALMKQAPSEERRSQIQQAGQRLVDQAGQGMGTVYRALGVTGLRGTQTDHVWPFVS